MKTCINSEDEQADVTIEGWNLFRKLLHMVVTRHKNIDI
jgi:hypothetical protein